MSDCLFTSVYKNAIFASFALATDNNFQQIITDNNFQRDQLFKELSEIYNLDSLSNEDIFLHIMCALEHDVLKSVFTFINSCFITRNCSNTSLVAVK